jgi:ATP-dependent Lhr-like helicase
MEARGEVRGGRFVDGVWGEQFALAEAVAKMRSLKKEEKKGVLVCISAADPLNLQGVITPGRKIPSYLGNRILFRDGIPVAVYESEEVNFLIPVDNSEKWELQNALIRRNVSPKLRPYLGKGIM